MKKSVLNNTPVYIATNFLESMINNSKPTRAEINDIVSTINNGVDGLVLAAETAIGKHPIECVEIIHKLIDQYERWTPNSNLVDILYPNTY